MRIETDDELYRVDAVWLGPKGFTFPWRIRYVQWGIGFAAFFLLLSIVREFFPFGFFTVAWTIIGTVLATKAISAFIDAERPIGQMMTLTASDVGAPRGPGRSEGTAADLSRVRQRPPLRRRS